MASKQPSSSEPLARAASASEARKILDNVGEVEPLGSIEEQTDLARRERESDLRMKERYGRWLLYFLVGQMVVADLVFVLFASIGVHWHIGAAIMDAWLGATVVQVVSIVLVIVTHLFPPKES